MKKFYRSLLWTGAVMALVAGCGDDVTINPPVTVSVGPDGVTLAIGETVQMSAAVNAAAGVPTTVTWSSSDPTKASVSSSGLVTAVASGSVAIQACSTENTSACGQATVTVAAQVPATITIQSITNTVIDINGGASEVPVNVNNVAGQINVSLNFEPGSTPATAVELLIDGDVVATQTFSLQEWAALVSAAVEEGGDLADVVIQMSVNTARFDLATGVPDFFNGPRTLSARAVLQGGNQTAETSQALVFNNASGFVATLTTDNGADPSSAINPSTGLQWVGGNVVINLVGVSYVEGTTVASVGFTVLGKVRVAALTNGVATLNWSEGTVWTAGNTGVGNYLSPAAGEAFTAPSAVLSNGQSVPVPAVGSILLNGSNASLPPLQTIRMDNNAPGVVSANGLVQVAPVIAAIPSVWVNASQAFAAGQLGVPTLASLNTQTPGPGNDVEEGVDAITLTFFATAAGAALPANCATTGMTAVTTGSDLAETTVSSAYRVRVIFKDGLGNQTCMDLAPGAVVGGQLGADFTAPTGTIAGPEDGDAFNATGDIFVFDVTDNASGFSATPVFGTLRRQAPPAVNSCVLGATAACNPAVLPDAEVDLVGDNFEIDAFRDLLLDGYYTFDPIVIRDEALNELSFDGRTYLLDQVPAAFSGGMSLEALMAGNATVTFTSAATDNIDIANVRGELSYPGPVTLQYEPQAIGEFGPEAFTTTSAIEFQVANFMRCLNPAGDFATTTNKANLVNLLVSDFAQAAPTSFGGFIIPGANVQTCGAVGNIPVINSFLPDAASYGPGKTQVSISGLTTGVNSATVTTSFVADVPQDTSADPFSRVEIWYENAAGNLVRIGTASVELEQTPGFRTYTYSVTWNPDEEVDAQLGGIVAPTAVNVFAIGVDAQGDAVLTAALVVTVAP